MSDLKDVKEVEVFHAGNVSVDELPWIPYFGDAKFKLLKANPVTGQTVTLLCVPAKMQLPAHFHSGTVIVYTVQGTWRYLEEPGSPNLVTWFMSLQAPNIRRQL